MRLCVLYNPSAGRGRAKKKIDEVVRACEAAGPTDVIETRDALHLSSAAAAASRDDYDRIILCGGDGTLNLALRDLDLSNAKLALIPLGTGDDFAGALNIPKDTTAAIRIALGTELRTVDVAVVNGVRYLGIAGVGFDSEVSEHANQVRFLSGPLVYLYSIFAVLRRFKPLMLTVQNEAPHEVMFAVVANSFRYGGGIRIAPMAAVDDGILDLVMVGKTSRRDLLKNLPRSYRGEHILLPHVTSRTGASFTLDTSSPALIYADGERVAVTPATFTVMRQALKIAAASPNGR